MSGVTDWYSANAERIRITREMMCDLPRYHVLGQSLRQIRDGLFEIEIDGKNLLAFSIDDLALEGANTLVQVHWRVALDDFANRFNAAQWLTPLAVAAGANSPFLSGHELWDETRIALSKQTLGAVLDKHKVMKMFFKVLVSGLFLAGVISSAWADETYLPNTDTAGMAPAPLIEIRNARQVFPGILSGGQPTAEQLQQAQRSGFKTVINLRPVAETGGDEEARMVRSLGMTYIHIPVAGAAGVTRTNSQSLVTALADTDAYPVIVHCASGNRVGALFALDAGLRANRPVEEAIVIGQQAGMTALKGWTQQRIEQEKAVIAAASADDAQGNCDSNNPEFTLAANSVCE